jgi:hypothetical protein
VALRISSADLHLELSAPTPCRVATIALHLRHCRAFFIFPIFPTAQAMPKPRDYTCTNNRQTFSTLQHST